VASITETFIKPQVFRPPQKANYTISDILESELSSGVQTKLNTSLTINVSTLQIGGLIPSTIPTTLPALIGGFHPSNV
jgi:hypothetical protein